MLRGARINLRTLKTSDLEAYHRLTSEIGDRGRFYPLDLKSEVMLRQEFEKTGYWGAEWGVMLIEDAADGRILGQIVFFKTVHFYKGFEVGYVIFDPKDHGKGYATEAARLFCKYLFDSKFILRLTIQCEPGNLGSRRVAEKSGFKFEGVARSVFESHGKIADIEVWSLTHADIYSDPSYA